MILPTASTHLNPALLRLLEGELGDQRQMIGRKVYAGQGVVFRDELARRRGEHGHDL